MVYEFCNTLINETKTKTYFILHFAFVFACLFRAQKFSKNQLYKNSVVFLFDSFEDRRKIFEKNLLTKTFMFEKFGIVPLLCYRLQISVVVTYVITICVLMPNDKQLSIFIVEIR